VYAKNAHLSTKNAKKNVSDVTAGSGAVHVSAQNGATIATFTIIYASAMIMNLVTTDKFYSINFFAYQNGFRNF
jgi:hypothetical protein